MTSHNAHIHVNKNLCNQWTFITISTLHQEKRIKIIFEKKLEISSMSIVKIVLKAWIKEFCTELLHTEVKYGHVAASTAIS
jgi:hypothetical protein